MTNHKQFQIKKKNLKNIFGCYNTKDSLTGNSGFSKKKKQNKVAAFGRPQNLKDMVLRTK